MQLWGFNVIRNKHTVIRCLPPLCEGQLHVMRFAVASIGVHTQFQTGEQGAVSSSNNLGFYLIMKKNDFSTEVLSEVNM